MTDTTHSPLSSLDPLVANHSTLRYREKQVQGVRVFYREAGTPSKPVLLLLHGFPSSSRMFDTLIPLLADHFHLIAPDYPAFGQSEAPPPSLFPYTFEHLTDVLDDLVGQLGLTRYSLYLSDYGGPIGFRLALRHPERVQAMIIQNAVSHEEGLGPLWDARRAFWRDRPSYEKKVLVSFTSLEGARERHVGSSPNVDRYNPDTWMDEYAILSRPGVAEIHADLFYDYRTNVEAYPRWQAWLRTYRPKMLIAWGKYDPSFTVAGAEAYLRDVPDAELHLLEAGHFALDEAVDQIARLILDFQRHHQIGK